MNNNRKYKIVYCTPALYAAGGVERVLTLKANYFAEHFGYDVTIILTEGAGIPHAYHLSDRVKVINLDIGFEELWTCPFVKKVFVYLKKQRLYKKRLTEVLMRIKPDITDSLLRREINFLTNIKDGSKKIGELHINRGNYRNFEGKDSNILKDVFSKFWMHSLVRHLRSLDKFIVLTEEDKFAWAELDNVVTIPNPISFETSQISDLSHKRVLAVGRYTYQKGFDLLLKAWSLVEPKYPDWRLDVYGQGNREPYLQLKEHLGLKNCSLNSRTSDIQEEYINSSLYVVSSRFEGLSMAMLEAMSFGLPIVSFACPCGPIDVITNGIDGVLIEKENVEQLAEGIMSLLSSPDKTREIAKNAKLRSNDFRMEVLANKWKLLFDDLYK